MDDKIFRKTLSENKLSCTSERKFIFSVLESKGEPLTMYQLVLYTSSKLNRSTVYRVINLFEKIGIVTKIHSGWKYKIELSDAFNGHHHHITCNNCEAIVSFEESHELLHELKKIEIKYKFSATSHNLELRGLCQKCLLTKL